MGQDVTIESYRAFWKNLYIIDLFPQFLFSLKNGNVSDILKPIERYGGFMKYILISILTAAADLLTKEAVKRKVPVGERKRIFGRLYLWHIKNRGLAYNKFEDNQERVVALSSAGVGAVAICLLCLIHAKARPSEKIGPALILGGGLGNLIDRIRNKEVTDFIYIKAGNAPIFNFADIAAVCGGVVTIVKSFV